MKCQQVRFLLRAVREGAVPGLSPWLVDGHLLLVSSYGLPFVYVCDLISSSYKDTSHIGIELTLRTPF